MFYISCFGFFILLNALSLIGFHWHSILTNKENYEKREFLPFSRILRKQSETLLPLADDQSSITVVGNLISLMVAWFVLCTLLIFGSIFGKSASLTDIPSFLHPSWVNYYLQSVLNLSLLIPAVYLLEKYIPQEIRVQLVHSKRLFFYFFSQSLIALQISGWIFYRSMNGWFIVVNALIYLYVSFWQWDIIRTDRLQLKQRNLREIPK